MLRAHQLEATIPTDVAEQLTIVDDATPLSVDISDVGNILPNLFDPLAATNRIMETRAHALEVTPVDETDILAIEVDTTADVLLMGPDHIGTATMKGIVSYS